MVFYFGKIFKWFFILEKNFKWFFILEKNYVVFSFGTNEISDPLPPKALRNLRTCPHSNFLSKFRTLILIYQLTHNGRGLGTNFVKFVKNVRNINFYEFQAPSKFPLGFPDFLGFLPKNSPKKIPNRSTPPRHSITNCFNRLH